MTLLLAALAMCASAPSAASPSETEMTATPRARYEAWLQERGAAGEIRTGPKLGESPFELFFVAGPPGVKLHPAAVSATEVVVPNEPPGWGPFLRSADATVLHGQIGWLHGAWVAHAPSKPVTKPVLDRDPKAKQYVTEPTIALGTDGAVTFEGFYGQPPTMDPFRFRAVVDASGGATFSTEPVWKLP